MASFSVPCPKTSAFFTALKPSPNSSPKPQLSLSSQSSSQALLAGSSLRAQQGYRIKKSDVFKVSSQLNEVAIETSSNSVPVPEKKPEELAIESPVDDNIPDSASMSTFLAQVADLVELVDSRDIMELQLKQQGLELSIKKKEALQPVAAPMMMMPPQVMMSSQAPPAPVSAPAVSPALSAPASPLALPPPLKPKSSHPPLKCPMAGTFYRAPAPGAPAFVKVGDKIQKGQVVCIIEAMKLMNEIEADQSGTLVEIVAEDGKPVSVDTPLFIIEP